MPLAARRAPRPNRPPFRGRRRGQRRSVLLQDLPARPRIALLRGTPGLGDLLCAVPSWRALRRARPDARVTLVAQPHAADLAARLGAYVDDHLPFPGFPGLPDAGDDVRATVGFLAATQDRAFDLVVQQHGSGGVTNILARLVGGRRTAGFHEPGAYVPDPAGFIAYPGDAHEVHRHLRLLAHLGAPPAGEALELPIGRADRARAQALVGDGPPYVVLHPGASTAERRWPAGSFAEVGRTLARDGLRLIITGSGAETGPAAAVARAIGPRARSVAGRTDLGALAAIVDAAAAVVTNDTGTSHVAVARGTPSVVVVPGAPARDWLPLDERRHPAVLGDGEPPPAAVVLAALARARRHADAA
jgi:ADP-heptose:LPS heptosyltransferase